MQQRLRATFTATAKRWPFLVVLLAYKLLEDRFLSAINDFLDRQSTWGVGMLHLASENLAVVTWLLIPAVIVGIIIHAYIESKVPATLIRLSEECVATSAEILRFLGERNPVPSLVANRDNWQQAQQEYTQAFSGMMSDFDSKFGAKVVRLHDELSEAGFQDLRLERAYEHPTNTFGIRDVAFSLGALGERMARR
jgi:hypothetical protein